MPWENVGHVGNGQMPADRDWVLFCYDLAMTYLKFACGDPPAGCEIGVMWHDHELGQYPSIGVFSEFDPPWDYVRKCEESLERFDNAISWTEIHCDYEKCIRTQSNEIAENAASQDIIEKREASKSDLVDVAAKDPEKPLILEIAENLGKEPEGVSSVIDEFLLQLHRRLFEYVGLNGDYIGEELHYHVGKQSFYHLLGFLECFSRRYDWDEGSSSEYLLRLGGRAKWLPYWQQIKAWNYMSRK